MPATSTISAALLSAVVADIVQWEATYLWMYLDSAGNVTVGTGTLLSSAAAAAAIPFIHDKTSAPATVEEITAAWNLLHAGSNVQATANNSEKYSANHYSASSDLRISAKTANDLTVQHISADYSSLQLLYAQFDNFPNEAKIALFDMIYNLGAGGLATFKTMNGFVNKMNWSAAASNCQRAGIPIARNNATRQHFLNCIKNTTQDGPIDRPTIVGGLRPGRSGGL